MKGVFAVIILVVAALGFIIYSYLYAGCGSTDVEYAKSRVIEHLEREGLPTEYLMFDEVGTTECKVSFNYNSSDQNIHFVVIDGGKVTWWDFNAPDQ